MTATQHHDERPALSHGHFMLHKKQELLEPLFLPRDIFPHTPSRLQRLTALYFTISIVLRA